jgi:MFS family permease
MASLTYTELLRGNRHFRRLLAGQVASEFGNWFNFIVGLGLVRAVTGAAPEPLAILIVLRLAPFALVAPLAGALVDRWSRRVVMVYSDLGRAALTLGFLLIGSAEDLWIAYACTLGSGVLSAFFEGAKNASVPNVVGDRGLLAGNALMFSSRFLLMAVGAAVGGEASHLFGYDAAFAANALTFLVSAYSVWGLPESAVRAPDSTEAGASPGAASETAAVGPLRRVWSDMREGWSYIAANRMVAAIIGLNVTWAIGGGAVQIVYERLGAVTFVGEGGPGGDRGVAIVQASVGLGLFAGMMLARRVGSKVEVRNRTPAFIGWTIIAHGLIFALAGLMPTLWLAALMIALSRLLIGVEFAVQETMLMRLLPDRLRGRVSTTDRAAEIAVMSLSGVLAGWSLTGPLTPRGLAVVSGLLSAGPGLFWLLLFASGKLSIPARAQTAQGSESSEEALATTA